MLAVGVKAAFGVLGALIADPHTELVAIDCGGQRDAGLTMAFDVAQQSAKTLLPLVGEEVP